MPDEDNYTDFARECVRLAKLTGNEDLRNHLKGLAVVTMIEAAPERDVRRTMRRGAPNTPPRRPQLAPPPHTPAGTAAALATKGLGNLASNRETCTADHPPRAGISGRLRGFLWDVETIRHPE